MIVLQEKGLWEGIPNKLLEFSKKEHKGEDVLKMNPRGQVSIKAPIATKVVCFSRLLKCLRSLYGKQCGPSSDCSYNQPAPIGAVCSGSTLFVSILSSSVMLGNYLQQMTSEDDIFRCIFFLGALRVKRFISFRSVPNRQKACSCMQTVKALTSMSICAV